MTYFNKIIKVGSLTDIYIIRSDFIIYSSNKFWAYNF